MIYDVTLTFLEPLLGTVPRNKEIYSDFVASKAPDVDADDEIESVPEDPEKGITGFHRNPDGRLIIYNYVIKGFFKDACSMLRRVPDTASKKVTAYKKIIDGLIFVTPRQIVIEPHLFKISPPEMLERPLRANTAKGERIALAKSEMVPEGSYITFEVEVLGGVSKKLLIEWLKYGSNRGLGQWRNASYGSFEYSMSARR